MAENGDQPAQKVPSTPQERFAAAEAKREAGNEKFRQGDAAGALREYELAKKHLAPIHFEDVDDEAVLQELQTRRVPLMLNLALSYLKCDPPRGLDALEACEEVLETEPENVKATYRKAKALVIMDELQEAEWEFVRAVKLAPGDSAIRGDLEALRRRMRDEKEQEKRMLEGIFDKAPGFASSDRAAEAQEGAAQSSNARADYRFLRKPEENPFSGAAKPVEEAVAAMAAGRLEEAAWAYEAALQQTAQGQDWAAHFPLWLELGRLLTDLNVDALAIRCFNRAAGVVSSGDDPAAVAAPSVRRNALLLRAICLLNEAESDTLAEVSACLAEWLGACEGAPEADGQELEARIARWRADGGAGLLAADAAVAQGLLQLLGGRDEAAQAFADALLAPEDEGSCFGPAARRAAKWNMLGAVLANRGRSKDALPVYDQALAVQPHYPRALVNRGIALQALPDQRAAAACFVAALELVPDWCGPLVWPLLKKSLQEQPGTDGSIAEAEAQESLPRLRELLGPGLPQGVQVAPPEQVLRSIGLAGTTGSA